MRDVRPAAVAGTFYPGNAAELAVAVGVSRSAVARSAKPSRSNALASVSSVW